MAGKRKMMVIINPIAGSVVRHNAEAIVTEKAAELGYDVEVRHTEYAGHARELALEAVAGGYYAVLACGGDGTVNEVASGLCDSRVVLGIIPLGSGNGLARHLGIPMTVVGAMKVVGEDRILNCDYATANGRPFFCTFGVGFDAVVTDRFSRLPGRGLKNYIRTALEEVMKYKSEHYTIISNGRTLTEKAMVVACCNASQYGNNAYIAPHASIKDGLLDITIIHSGNLVETAMTGMELLTGFVGNTTQSSTFRTRELTIIRRASGQAHYDGEPAELPERIEITCHPAGLNVFATERKRKMHALMSPDIPIISPMILTLRDLRHKIYNLFS